MFRTNLRHYFDTLTLEAIPYSIQIDVDMDGLVSVEIRDGDDPKSVLLDLEGNKFMSVKTVDSIAEAFQKLDDIVAESR